MLIPVDPVSTSLSSAAKERRATLHRNCGAHDLARRVRSRYRTPRPTARISSRSGSAARTPSPPQPFSADAEPATG